LKENSYHFYSDCVNWPKNDVEALTDMIDRAIDISRRTFLKHVDRENLREIEKSLGYEAHHNQGLTMAGDWHVSYHRSKWHEDTVYYFKHSGIEHVFVNSEGLSQDVAAELHLAAGKFQSAYDYHS